MSPYGARVMPVWIVGIVMSIASLLQAVLEVPAGILLDRYGYKRLLKVTIIAFIASAVCLLWSLNVWTYLLTSVVSCFGWLFFAPGVNAYTISHSSKNTAGTFISFRDVFRSIGVVISSMLLAFSLIVPVRAVATAVITIMLISLLLLSFSPYDVGSVNNEKKLKSQNYYIKRQYIHRVVKSIKKLNPAAVMLLISGLCSSIFYALIWFVVPLLIANHAVAGYMSWSLGIFDLAIILVGSILGKIADYFNKEKLVFWGLLIFSIAGIFIGFNLNLIFLLFGFLAAVGDEMTKIALWIWLNDLEKNHDDDGLISGVVQLFEQLGWVIGPVVGGFLYTSIGAKYTIMIGGIFILISWLFYCFRVNKKYKKVDLLYSSIDKMPMRVRSKH
jgi:MFS family permease